MGDISISRFFYRSVFRYSVLALFSAVCLGHIDNTGADTGELAKNEGVIIGSIIVNVANPREKSSFLRGGRKLARIKWALVI